MKKLVIIIICLLTVLPAMASRDSKVTYFSPRSLYVYAMGSCFFDLPFVDFCDTGDFTDFNPMVGVGFTIVNFNHVFLLNLEFDYVRNQSPSCDPVGMNRLDYYSFWLNMEYRFGHLSPFALYVGTGVAVIDDTAPYSYSDSFSSFVSGLGMKLAVSRHLMLRFDIRHYFDSDDGLDYLYFDDWGDVIIGLDSYYRESYGTAVSAGLEYHF